MSKTNTIITIGREFGSGGHEIGERLSEKLEIPFYDKEMLDRASKDSGIAEELLKAHDEKPTSSFLYSLVMDTYSLGYKSGATLTCRSTIRSSSHSLTRLKSLPKKDLAF